MFANTTRVFAVMFRAFTSICCDVPCLYSQRDRGAMIRVVQTPFALTRQRPEGK